MQGEIAALHRHAQTKTFVFQCVPNIFVESHVLFDAVCSLLGRSAYWKAMTSAEHETEAWLEIEHKQTTSQ